MNEGRKHHCIPIASVALGVAGCGVVPPPYPSPQADGYCAELLVHMHRCSGGATGTFLVFLCITVAAGFLAAQLNNDINKEGFIKKNQSTFLFVVAVLSGILGAYFHSRADASAAAAGEIQMAMTVRDSAKRYDMCLVAASRWDGSMSKSLEAATSAVPTADGKATTQLADAVDRSHESRSRMIRASEEQRQVLGTVLDAIERALPAGKKSKQLKEDLANAREKLGVVKNNLGEAESIGDDTKNLVDKARKTLQAEEGAAPEAPKTDSKTSEPAGDKKK